MTALALWLHLVAAGIWLGGMVFIAAVLVPVARTPEFAPRAAELIRATGHRFRNIGWAALAVLILTGFVNLQRLGFEPAQLLAADMWSSPFGMRLAAKLVLVCLVLAASLVHDFSIGPRAVDAALVAGRTQDASRLRRRASLIGRFNLIASLLIMALGVLLTHG